MKFLIAIGLDSRTALLNYRCDPLNSRRDIAMLGFLHGIILGLAPSCLSDFFPFNVPVSHRRSVSRSAARTRNKQLVDKTRTACSDLLRRSVLGVVSVYNLLPQFVVDCCTVSDFQSMLQHVVAFRARSSCEYWSQFLNRSRLMPIISFQASFYEWQNT